MSRRFDRILLSQTVCRETKVRHLSDDEFRCFIAALCLCGSSPVRGDLLIARNVPATAADIADEARSTTEAATRMLDKMTAYGTFAERPSGTLYCVNWSDYNPAPKPSDSRPAWRERKRRQRERAKEQMPEQHPKERLVPKKERRGVPQVDQQLAAKWDEVVAQLVGKIDPHTMDVWIAALVPVAITDDEVVVWAEASAGEWIAKRYGSVIQSVVAPRKLRFRR